MKWLFRLLIVLLVFTGMSMLGYWYVQDSLSSSITGQQVELEVERGDSILNVGRLLEEKKLIKNDRFFAVYAFLQGKTQGIKAGVYVIPEGSDANDILDIITVGKENVLRLTIPEGYTVDRIARRLEEQGVDSSKFIQAVEKKAYPEYSFVRDIPRTSNRRHRLEGYLYPITYSVPKGTDPEKLVDKMLAQFEKQMEQNDIEEKLKKKELTVDEWVTIASIVEREGKVQQELPRIAGVIYNRLDRGQKLQVDATVQYALGEQKERLYYKDLKVQSPYNTYREEGLPPGPIANPGPEALDAALNPEKHDYFFYVTKKDGSGEHYFAETEEEHNYNIERSKKENTPSLESSPPQETPQTPESSSQTE